MTMIAAEIPLRQWIKTAVQHHRNSNGLSSAYLVSSLRIAISLTEQIISSAEDDLGSLPRPFPVACIDWADCATVQLKPTNPTDHRSGSLPPPSFEAPVQVLEEDLDAPVDKNAEAHVNNESIDSIGGTGTMPIEIEDSGYLDVDSAFISWDGSSTFLVDEAHNSNRHEETLQRIYSLGLLFYELFSGGDLPPPEYLVVSLSMGGDLTAIGGAPGSANYGNASASLDFSTGLNIMSHEDELPEHDSILRSLNSNDVLCDGSNNGFTTDLDRNRTGCIRPSEAVIPSGCPHVLCNVSTEYLTANGFPNHLADVICNMIDCINGDFARDDSYTQLSDVICDLQWLLNNPSTLVLDLDPSKLSLWGLESGEHVFDRDDEFSSLQSSYQRSISGLSELAIISGVSGTGKSTVAKRFGNLVTANGGVFLTGKFDLIGQIKPFSAVASAFNEYCDILASEEESKKEIRIASKLQSTLGSDLYYLMQVIPNLIKIIKKEPNDPPSNQDCVDPQQRLHFLFCRFVEVVSCCSGAPITLFIDDLQWADSSSLSIISHLLKASRSMKNCSNIFFLGCYRDDEMESDHIFWKMVESVRGFGFNATLVKLDCMNKDSVNRVMSNLLYLSPRTVRTLSDAVYHKTKGNPLFVTRMVLSLYREGLLRINRTKNRWEWDEENILMRKLPDDVAFFFVQSISSLPTDVNVALGALSCFGASTDREVLEALEADLELKLLEPLKIAIEEGLVIKLDDTFHFCHDRIQEAAYSMIEEHVRRLNHLNYGLSLIDLSTRTGNQSFFFTAITQLNLGGPSAVQVDEQFSVIAGYNLTAGKKAMEMSDFSAAFIFFDHGITFLRKKHWQDHYDLSLELFTLAAKCALAAKKLTSLSIICDQVSRNARTFEDTLSTSFILVTSLAYSNISEAVDYSVTILSMLDVEIPDSYSQEDTLRLITSTQSMLSSMSDETLLSYKVMSDQRKLMAIKFLARLEYAIFQTNPSLQPFITTQIIRLTIEHGVSPVSAVGFTYFGGMLAKLGDIRGGYRYTKLAKELLDKHQCIEISGEVFWLLSEFLCFVEPLPLTNNRRIQGQASAMAVGDVHWACMNQMSFATALAHLGLKLSHVKTTFKDAGRFMEEHGHLTSLNYLRICEQAVSALIGNENEDVSDDELTRRIMQSKNPYQLTVLFTQKLFLHVVLNNYAELKWNAEKFIAVQMPSWNLLSGHYVQSFFVSLASYRVYRETGDQLWAERGKEHQERIARWKEQGSVWNFENKSFLLDAEESYSNGDFETAKASYDRAISSAREHNFVQEEALASELAGNFLFNTGEKTSALKYYIVAYNKYHEWGASAKVAALYAFMRETFQCNLSSHAVSTLGVNDELQSDRLSADTQQRLLA